MSISKETPTLINDTRLLLEAPSMIAPLAARIYALLTVSSHEGLTFEEISIY